MRNKNAYIGNNELLKELMLYIVYLIFFICEV